jgi:divalent metal cation (Fe/Co/Zn/Cd) transporter
VDPGQPLTRPAQCPARPGGDAARLRLARSAVVACACSVAWAALAGVASVAAGTLTESVALLAFGLDSVIDGSASAVLVWRFRLELRQARHPAGAERAAARAVAAAMLAAAVYVAAQAARALTTRAHPGQSAAGIVLLAASVAVLPVLGSLKLRLAASLASRALRGDGVLSVAGAALAAVALAGLAAERLLGWWQADPAAASLIALFLLREGWRTLRLPG